MRTHITVKSRRRSRPKIDSLPVWVVRKRRCSLLLCYHCALLVCAALLCLHPCLPAPLSLCLPVSLSVSSTSSWRCGVSRVAYWKVEKPLCAARSLRCVKSPLPPCLYSNRAGAERDARTRGGVESQRRKRKERETERETEREGESAVLSVSPTDQPPHCFGHSSGTDTDRPPPPLTTTTFPSPSPALFLLLGCPRSLAKYTKKGCLLIACYTLVNSPCNIC